MKQSLESKNSLKTEESVQTVERYAADFNSTLDNVRESLGDSGWWVVGSNARRALLGISPTAEELYSNGKPADLDLVVISSHMKKFNALREVKHPIPVGGGLLNSYLSIGEITPSGLPTFVQYSVGKSFSGQLEPEFFKTYNASVFSETFPTLARETLLLLYPIGGPRQKDFPRMNQLLDSVRENSSGAEFSDWENVYNSLMSTDRPMQDRVAKRIVESSVYRSLRKKFPDLTATLLGSAKKILIRK